MRSSGLGILPIGSGGMVIGLGSAILTALTIVSDNGSGLTSSSGGRAARGSYQNRGGRALPPVLSRRRTRRADARNQTSPPLPTECGDGLLTLPVPVDARLRLVRLQGDRDARVDGLGVVRPVERVARCRRDGGRNHEIEKLVETRGDAIERREIA